METIHVDRNRNACAKELLSQVLGSQWSAASMYLALGTGGNVSAQLPTSETEVLNQTGD